jgi:hypothetical protein
MKTNFEVIDSVTAFMKNEMKALTIKSDLIKWDSEKAFLLGELEAYGKILDELRKQVEGW